MESFTLFRGSKRVIVRIGDMSVAKLCRMFQVSDKLRMDNGSAVNM